MLNGSAIWRVSGLALPDRRVVARSFDEAVKKARVWDSGYCAAQVVEDLDAPDFIGGAPNYDKLPGVDPALVLARLNID